MRDSSLAYETYYLRNGESYSRMPTLGSLRCSLPEDKLASIPAEDRRILEREAAADPAFCRKIAALMAGRTNWAHETSEWAKRVVANEVDPALFPQTRGQWPVLRAQVRSTLSDIAGQIRSSVSRMTLGQKVGIVRKIAARGKSGVSGLGELGQWDILGGLISTAGKAYESYVVNDTKSDIAKLQSSTAMQTAGAQMAIANANAAIAAAQAQQAVASNPVASVMSAVTQPVFGIPAFLIPVGMYFAWKAMGRR